MSKRKAKSNQKTRPRIKATPRRDGAASDKAQAVAGEIITLRTAGASYTQIAKTLSVTVKVAKGVVARAVLNERLNRETEEEAKSLSLARLDAMQAAIWPQAQGPSADARAIKTVLDIMEARRKLLRGDEDDAEKRKAVAVLERLSRGVGHIRSRTLGARVEVVHVQERVQDSVKGQDVGSGQEGGCGPTQ